MLVQTNKPWRSSAARSRFKPCQHGCGVLKGAATPIITLKDALQSLRAVEAVRRSIDPGSTIALNDLN